MNYELRIKEGKAFHNSLFLILDSLKFLLFNVKVSGESGWPQLVPGKRYFASGLFSPRVGDFIVFKNPRNSEGVFVKKVTATRDGGYEVAGTVSWATSSKEIGIVPRELVLGKLLR